VATVGVLIELPGGGRLTTSDDDASPLWFKAVSWRDHPERWLKWLDKWIFIARGKGNRHCWGGTPNGLQRWLRRLADRLDGGKVDA